MKSCYRTLLALALAFPVWAADTEIFAIEAKDVDAVVMEVVKRYKEQAAITQIGSELMVSAEPELLREIEQTITALEARQGQQTALSETGNAEPE